MKKSYLPEIILAVLITILISMWGFFFIIPNNANKQSQNITKHNITRNKNHKNVQTNLSAQQKRQNIQELKNAPILNTNEEYYVTIDSSQTEGLYKNLLGVNKSPILKSNNKSKKERIIDFSQEYKLLGISEIRMHDDDLDICKIYKDDVAIEDNNKTDFSNTCRFNTSLDKSKKPHHMTWSIKNPNTINNSNNYNYYSLNDKISAIKKSGAKLYLRLGESWLGPNDVKSGNEKYYAAIATNIFKHFYSKNKELKISAVEIHNEADGKMFWNGKNETYYNIIKNTIASIKPLSNNIKIGAGGFTSGVNNHFNTKNNVLNPFIQKIGANNLDFFSAHYYGDCSKENADNFIKWFETLKDNLNQRGMQNKPIHITEWNIGTGIKCEILSKKSSQKIAYQTPHMFSYTAGMLLLMQDMKDISHALFYAGNGSNMSLFIGEKDSNNILINKAVLAFYLHKELKESQKISTKICHNKLCGKYSYIDNVFAKGFKTTNGYKIIIVNDTNKNIKTNLNFNQTNKFNFQKAIQTIYLPPKDNSYLALQKQQIKNTYTNQIYIPKKDALQNYISKGITRYKLTTSRNNSVYTPAYSVSVLEFKN